ncbi:SIR2 family protein [Maribacter polysiphoniae]|uniref:SIR2 family protein n=1 Tax=Maribacter polysiphoniae TaxID=429344 RepID=A0A316DHC5_9FLAO|nr:SIR2 family protein [Maribacter polysiphoniae]MBD1261794.1 SIR2 family protein [Maribacter polysiphoniae]PWK17048.1 SIR2-like protein [Maribacter polysiphoniae]
MITNKITIDGITTIAELDEAKSKIESDVIQFFRDDEKIPLNKLAKYYLNENLNFLCGSGTSVAIGGKTINKDENPFDPIITELKAINPPKEHINQLIKFFESDILLEKKFDKINQEYLYYLNNKEDSDSATEIKSFLDKALKIFVDKYVPFPIEYVSENLGVHELFINKIISRKETLSRPKIFTPNYDLAFENSCEKIGVSYNNGFRGVHMRKFDPDTFHNETYIKQDSPEKGKRIATYLNIYKLHGSISWQYAESINDLYNLKEIQISDTAKKEDFSFDSLMIYPIQTKKSYSLDLPYSELFRNFSKCLTESQNTLVIIGYSFLDEHINDIIRTGLYNPNLTVIIHSYGLVSDESPLFLQTLKNRSVSDNRIIIFEGALVGDFTNIVKYLIPLNSFIPTKETIIETLKELTK